ncbi:MAG: DNA adenine methylase [Thaumarchaeota archaeon]|nr:DNA adenine methylase [Nitrososphaerota archaeon]
MKDENRFADKKFPKINFIGNKEKITGWMFDNIDVKGETFFDAFSGGCSVSFEAKKRGYKVITNDILKINYFIGKSLIENKKITLSNEDVDTIFSGHPVKGFMYENYSNVTFFPEECMELDLYRKNIEKLRNPYKKTMAFILLRRSMIRKMPYSRFTIPWNKVKQLRDENFSYMNYGRKRAYHNQSFREHFSTNLQNYNDAVFDNGKDNKSYNEDIFDLLPRMRADIIYLDPPYSGSLNNYYGFYGMLDEYIESKRIEPSKNNFSTKKNSFELLANLFAKLKNFRYWLLSYNNNSYPRRDELTALIKRYASDVHVIDRKHNYQITGRSTKTKNIEYLFIIRSR